MTRKEAERLWDSLWEHNFNPCIVEYAYGNSVSVAAGSDQFSVDDLKELMEIADEHGVILYIAPVNADEVEAHFLRPMGKEDV